MLDSLGSPFPRSTIAGLGLSLLVALWLQVEAYQRGNLPQLPVDVRVVAERGAHDFGQRIECALRGVAACILVLERIDEPREPRCVSFGDEIRQQPIEDVGA